VLAASTMAAYGYIYINSAPGSLSKDVVVEIKRGSSFYAAANRLKEKGVINSVRLFRIYAGLDGFQSKIKAGEYLVRPAMTAKEIAATLVKGDVIQYKITIPEGYNLYQIADLLEEKEIVVKKVFIEKVFDKRLMSGMGVEGVSFEGYLYPETYFFTKNMKAKDIIARMRAGSRDKFTRKLKDRSKEIGLTPHQVIILASIIEKETGNPDERPIISAVFHNRLKKKMRLQTDPTVIYGMIETYDGNIRKKDLLKKTPYNTYRISGLPLGPIANPGIDSIMAALYPADVGYIYFVSMNNGSHIFSRTLKEHNKGVWKYQKRRKR
jgi:UPF0755 protein